MNERHPLTEFAEGQISLGEYLRDEGMARVSSLPERQAWLAEALDLIERMPRGLEFSADFMRQARPAPHENLVGVLFRKAKAAGLIEAVGFTQSTHPSRHASVQRMWVRL